ncbi:MAG: aminodeoxychorismate synthase component I [Erythrobacter sp.]
MEPLASPRSFVLLDDARDPGAIAGEPVDALLYTKPREVFVAHRVEEVASTLEAAEAARKKDGELAGYIAYEAGLALEGRLAVRADARSGGAGPLVWLGLFDAPETIAASDMPGWLATRASGPATLGPLDPQLSPGGYAQGFAVLKQAIEAGDIYQANYTYSLAGAYRGDTLALYAALREAAAAGHGGIVHDGSHWLLSFSPELLVAAEDGAVRVKPMKGTRPRRDDDAQDRAMAQELAQCAKDRAENLMIVDLMRNDLARVAEAGSVTVEDLFAVETYPSVHQMVSTVRAQLAQGLGAMDLVRALFPCGSITGAPKIRAMEILSEVERDARGAYCGAIGRISGEGSCRFNVAIRTVRLTPSENGHGRAVLGVGSAIVADSEALAERRECGVKASFARHVAPGEGATGADLIETMRFEPETGIALLDRHLERMKESARTLGYAFDRHAARNQIHALCFQLETPARMRLLLSRSGAIAVESGPLPEPSAEPFLCAAFENPVDPSDWRLAHKTTDRHFYDEAVTAARALGAREAILVRADGLVTEGCITNIFVDRGDYLATPPASLGLLPGILRADLIARGRAREEELTLNDLADGFWLANAVRGLFRGELI